MQRGIAFFVLFAAGCSTPDAPARPTAETAVRLDTVSVQLDSATTAKIDSVAEALKPALNKPKQATQRRTVARRESFRFRDRDPRKKLHYRASEAGVADSGAIAALRDLLMPVVGISPASLRDTYSSPRGQRPHGAIDIHAPLGTPVIASVDGTIWKVRSDRGGGKTVHLLDATGEYVLYYAHLSRYAEGLHEGQEVRKGDVIGYVGRTGDVVGSPHLHLRINHVPARDRERWWFETPLNPYPLLKRAGLLY